MSKIADFWKRLISSPAVVPPSFQIPAARITGVTVDETPFIANTAYFEIRIAEQFLKDKREYWNEYNPLTVVLTEFIYDKKRNNFPFVVGPSLLNGIGQLDGDERIRYKNTRVVGPTPYIGDEVSLFLGLFRVKTKDWARQALSLLETVAKVFDSTKLTSYLNISGPLTDGIESFFDMGDQMQFRLGQRNSFADPATNTSNNFAPGYYVIIRADQKKIDPGKFWVKEEQLHYGDDAASIKPYIDYDYLLYKIVKTTVRNDYTTFSFHTLFEEVQTNVWQDNLTKANEIFQSVILAIRRCADLTPPQIKQLTVFYATQFDEEQKTFNATKTPVPKSIGEEDTGAGNLPTMGTGTRGGSTITPPPQPSGEVKRGPKIDDALIARALQSPEYNDPLVLDMDENKVAPLHALKPAEPKRRISF
ncbi:hypothetical protein [Chitinophaga defluvii]|uniref:Uncharacterized protein n=1 Tax=Chitinophaga defluvii TaxID=3163343 RepID=A0ABV2T429_9BACT